MNTLQRRDAVARLLESREDALVITGLGSSALFPITVSRLAKAAKGLPGGSGWIFAFGAIGGALLPWLTGQLSGITGRIQIAFLVPLVSLVLVAVLGVLTAQPQDRGGHR